ncbi:MAG: AAA family ATPase [Desulfuromonadales bacterium]
MYTKYFGFNEKPFTLTPNPRFIYLSKNHKEAFAHLLYGINNHYGFIELIGEVGTGKTTVLRTLLSQLQEEHYRTALIVNPCLTGVELLRSISHEFGLNSTTEYTNELIAEFNNFLLAETPKGRTVVLVIDEAQNLHPAVLEQIRLLSNLETENDKLIQIVLAGQPELGTLLERPELRQLNQRIAVRYRLKSMSLYETRAYIRHRMEVAGETGGVSFSLFATRCIYIYTRGVPRMINILCDRSLLIAYGDERRRITAGIATRAIKELLNVPQRRRFSLAYSSIVVIAVFCIALYVNLSGSLNGKRVVRPHVSTAPVAAANSPIGIPLSTQTEKTEINATDSEIKSQQFLRLQQEILSYDHNDVHILAFNAIAEKWGVQPIKVFSGQFTVPDMLSRLAAKRNLSVTAFKGTLNAVIRFDIPFLVFTKVTDDSGAYAIAVTSVTNDSVFISPSLFGSNTIFKKDLSSIATGTFYLVWSNYGQIPSKIIPGDTRYEIRMLQQLLQQAGSYKDTVDGNYSILTAKAVSDFQRSAGIELNDTVGELTLAALSKYYTNNKVPSISAAESAQ